MKPLLFLAAGALAVTACSKPAPPAPAEARQGLLLNARKSDYVAQRRLAECYEQLVGCPAEDIDHDVQLGCAWRVAILVSRSPMIELADADRYEASCTAADEATRQKAFNAAADLVRDIYGRAVDVPLEGVASSSNPRTLYPSAETVRQKVNKALADAGDRRRLPAFAAAEDGKGVFARRLIFRSCDRDLCLLAVAPEHGGGLSMYKLSLSSPGPTEARVGFVVKLATAAIGSPSSAPDIVALARKQPSGSLSHADVGSACWGAGLDGDSNAIVGAFKGPCRTGWSG